MYNTKTPFRNVFAPSLVSEESIAFLDRGSALLHYRIGIQKTRDLGVGEAGMSVDGVWKVEMLGPYGWEPISTAFLESGKYRTASKDHFSQGTYTQNGDHLSIKADMTVYGEIRSLFGRRDSRFVLSIEADVSGDQAVGKANDHEGKFTLHFRAARLADLA